MSQTPTDKQAYLNATPMQREVVRRLLCDVLGCLRAMYLSYQTSHWMVVGGSFYGNHLLFQRLYKSVEEQVDQLAEKIVGYLGSEAVSINYQMRHISDYTYGWSSIGCNHKRGLQSEADLQRALKRAYDGIKQAQAMSLGLDDWIMATANAHEENEYLLQQALAPIPGEGKQAARQPRGRKLASPQHEGCSEEYLEDIEPIFTETVENFLERFVTPALKKRGWGLHSYGVVDFKGEEGALVAVELRAKAGQKIRLGGRKYIVLDRDVKENLDFWVTPKMEEEYFEESIQLDVDDFSDWSWFADCPTDEIRSLYYKPHSFDPTARGIEKLFAAFDSHWIRRSGVRSKIKKASTDEGYFYKAPNQRAVLEFANSNAISNDVAVAEKASKDDHLDISEAQAVAEAEEAPPLPTEIAKEPGAAAVSTLNQYVIKSEDPVAEKAIPMNEARMASWLKELE